MSEVGASNDGLSVQGLSVRFGGVQAVQNLSLEVPAGRLTGLIGPNGAGKTTTFNALSGLVRPTGGTMVLFGEDISHLSPPARAQRGLGRTFQRMELYDSLTVTENVAVGAEGRMAGSAPWRHVFRRRAEREAVADTLAEAIELCDLANLAGRRVGAISTGQRRLVELARVIAGDFRVLLLDEPSSGLDAAETRRFGAILRTVIESRGIGILLVEHDMALVMDLCDTIYVIDFGELIFVGSPVEVAESRVVQSAYLGSDAVGAT